MTKILQIKRDTVSNWALINPVLAEGEQGYETDTSKMKIGNGATTWTTLPYFADSAWGDITGTLTDQTDLQTEFDLKANKELEINNQTGTAYTLALTDSNKYIRMNNASANTVTVPDNATTAFPLGTQIYITQVGAGQTTIASSVTINTSQTLLLGKQFSSVVLIKVNTDEWDLAGDLELV